MVASYPRPRADSIRSCAGASPGVLVLVVAADPHLRRVALVSSLRRPVEQGVVAQQELEAARVARVGVVDDVFCEREGAESWPLRQVASRVGAARGRQFRNGSDVAFQE